MLKECARRMTTLACSFLMVIILDSTKQKRNERKKLQIVNNYVRGKIVSKKKSLLAHIKLKDSA